MSIIRTAYDYISDPEIWLPKKITWEDVIKYNKFSFNSMVLCPVIVAVLISISRIIFERYSLKNTFK